MKTDDLLLALGNPRKGEFAYPQFRAAHRGHAWAAIDRLDALAELKCLADASRIPAPAERRGTNTHVHTNESFSIFRSASDAAWQGFQAGLDVLGINDHYTIAGHQEFRQACLILGIRPTFSMEAVASDAACQARGIRCNDPANPGRTYLSAKGVIRDLPPGSPGRSDLDMMKRSLMERNKAIVAKLNTLLAAAAPKLLLSFDDVLSVTPRGNTTERHVCQALAELIDRSIPSVPPRLDYLRKLAGEFAEKDLETPAACQNALRASLVKAGKPAYVDESPQAFISWERMISMYLEYGAIPAYPVLGNPVVELEDDVESLFAQIEARNIHAIEVIPHRNTRERLAAILQTAAKHRYPVFNGTEHNTKSSMPLLDKWSGSDDFIGQFTLGANVLIGHQLLSACAGFGYVDPAGKPTVGDRDHALSLFSFAGRMIQKPLTLKLLGKLGPDSAARLLVGLHAIGAGGSAAWGIRTRARITPRQLGGVTAHAGKAAFASATAAEFMKNWAEENLA